MGVVATSVAGLVSRISGGARKEPTALTPEAAKPVPPPIQETIPGPTAPPSATITEQEVVIPQPSNREVVSLSDRWIERGGPKQYWEAKRRRLEEARNAGLHYF